MLKHTYIKELFILQDTLQLPNSLERGISWLTHDLITGFILGLISGVIAGLLANYLTIKLQKCMHNKAIKEKYSGPVGHYNGYGPKNGGDVIDPEDIISDVDIIYESENLLNLELREKRHKSKWTGTVAMENEHYGTITWRYDELHGEPVDDMVKHRFGFKRLMYIRRKGKKIVYLVGEKTDGYDKEILIEKS